MIKENSSCNSLYPETLWETVVHSYSKQNKHLIALECFFAAKHGLTETQFTFVVVLWRKSFDVNYFGTVHAGIFVGGQFKHFLYSRHKQADWTWYLPMGMQEPLLCEETFLLFLHGKGYSTYCTIKALPPVSQFYKLLPSCSEVEHVPLWVWFVSLFVQERYFGDKRL